MKRIVLAAIWLATLSATVFAADLPVPAAVNDNSDDVQRGRKLAVDYCALCHVVAARQPSKLIRRPPAPSFKSIAQRETTNADSLKTFLNTTHMGLENPNDMPNPRLTDFEVREVTAYLLSLRKYR